jgi:hypothetical protein
MEIAGLKEQGLIWYQLSGPHIVLLGTIGNWNGACCGSNKENPHYPLVIKPGLLEN